MVSQYHPIMLGFKILGGAILPEFQAADWMTTLSERSVWGAACGPLIGESGRLVWHWTCAVHLGRRGCPPPLTAPST